MSKPNYDIVAPYYDWLACLVFGNAILQAQQLLVGAIPPGSTVLVVGGGTGKILEEITCVHPAGLNIVYIEASKKMTELSRKRYTGNNSVAFINHPIEGVTHLPAADVVITPFFMDNFSNQSAEGVFKKLHSILRAGGLWLFADFQSDGNNSLWQKTLLKMMYIFFRLICKIEASQLPDTTALFTAYNYKLLSKQYFYKTFIGAWIYKKQ